MLIKVHAGVPLHMDATDTRTFTDWMESVNALIERALGLSAYDLPDCPYRDWYDIRLRPIRAANRALKNAGADDF